MTPMSSWYTEQGFPLGTDTLSSVLGEGIDVFTSGSTTPRINRFSKFLFVYWCTVYSPSLKRRVWS